MQTYLCVVHPIYQEDEQALQTQTKKEREEGRERERERGRDRDRERERDRQTDRQREREREREREGERERGQSCYSCFLSYPPRKNKSSEVMSGAGCKGLVDLHSVSSLQS